MDCKEQRYKVKEKRESKFKSDEFPFSHDYELCDGRIINVHASTHDGELGMLISTLYDNILNEVGVRLKTVMKDFGVDDNHPADISKTNGIIAVFDQWNKYIYKEGDQWRVGDLCHYVVIPDGEPVIGAFRIIEISSKMIGSSIINQLTLSPLVYDDFFLENKKLVNLAIGGDLKSLRITACPNSVARTESEAVDIALKYFNGIVYALEVMCEK